MRRIWSKQIILMKRELIIMFVGGNNAMQCKTKVL